MQKQHASANLNEVARGEHTFKINAYSITKDAEMLTAAVLTVAGYNWQIRCHPNADKTEYRGTEGDCGRWIKFDLTLASDADGVFAALTCVPVAPRGKFWRRLRKPPEKTVSCTFQHQQFTSPGLFLIPRDSVTSSSGYLVRDSLTVRCTVSVVVDQQRRASVLADVAIPSTDLHRQLGELLTSQKGADVKFIVSGNSFLAHRNILAARSPVFMAEFFGELKESSSVLAPQHVEIKDMEPCVFEALLRFIYTDTLPQAELDKPREEATLMAQHLLVAADRYGLERLKLICEEKLSASINVDMVATTLVLAEQHSFSLLKARCVDFIVSSPAKLSAVVATDGYKDLVASCPALLDYLLTAAVRSNHKNLCPKETVRVAGCSEPHRVLYFFFRLWKRKVFPVSAS